MGQTPANLGAATHQLKLVDQASQLYLNAASGRMYTKRSIVVGDISDREHQLSIYMFRRLNDGFVVSVDYCSSPEEGNMCSSSAVLTYFIEYQRSTLFDRTTMSFTEGVNTLLHVIRGFSILYNKFGYFTPTSRLIFFNHLGEPKVWINEDPKITKNLQNAHGSQSVAQENQMVREVVRLFDALRDPLHPMLSYSQFLPPNLLTFELAIECLIKRSMTCRPLSQKQVLTEVKNIRSQSPPTFHKHFKQVSYQNSPNSSPRGGQSPSWLKRESPPFLSFTYHSPAGSPTKTITNGKSLDKSEMKEAAKMSLKNTAYTGSRPIHMISPSRGFTATVPNSNRNSRTFQRQLNSNLFQKLTIVQRLDQSPAICPKNSASDLNININLIKREAAQRYSQAEHNEMPLSVKPGLLRVSLEEQTKYSNDPLEAHSCSEEERKTSNFMEMRTKNQSGPPLNDEPPVRRQFHSHKRHQTDFMMLNKMQQSSESQFNQISMVEGNNLSKFQLNTIKSIHLLDEDRELDRDIIVDLKKIINKYRRIS